MFLNEFLNFTMGVQFEDKYNALATKEILEHKEEYPLIWFEIDDMVRNAEDAEEEWDYSSDYFDCDDFEGQAGEFETLQLYQAFVTAFAKDLLDKPIKVDMASFGVEFRAIPNVMSFYNSFSPHRLGEAYVSVFSGETELGKDLCVSEFFDVHTHTYKTDNEKLLEYIGESFRGIGRMNYFFYNRFLDEDLKDRTTTLKTGQVAYACDSYEFRIGENILKFYTTERGFDAMSLFRLSILDSLTEEAKEHQIVKEIESFGREQSYSAKDC